MGRNIKEDKQMDNIRKIGGETKWRRNEMKSPLINCMESSETKIVWLKISALIY